MKTKLFFGRRCCLLFTVVFVLTNLTYSFANFTGDLKGNTIITVSDKPEKASNVLPVTYSLDNLYAEGDAADPFNETNSVGNWHLDESVSPDQTSFQSVSGGTNGLYSIMVKSEGWGYDNWGRIAFTFDGLDPNKSYKISWDAKSDDGAGNVGSGFVHLVGGIEDLSFRTTSTDWDSFSVCLTPENTSITLKIYPTAGRKIHEEFYIDNLFVVEDGCDDCEDNDNDGVCADVDCDDHDPNVTTSIADDSDRDGVNDCEDICEGFDDNVDADGDGIPDGCDDCVITTAPECTILATDDANINSDNTVIGDVCEDPAISLIPPFYTNTVSNSDSADLKVNDDETMTTNGEIFNKVEIKEGGTLTFTGSNIFINELKVEKYTTIKFENCANVFINHALRFEEYTNFNPDMNNVTLYVNNNVEVKKGSNITAHIYVDDNEIKAEGKADAPTYMKGVFVGKKVEGKYVVTWEGVEYCNPCPIEIPEPSPDCECDGGIVSVTFAYEGSLPTLSSDDDNASFTNNGDGTVTLATFDGSKLSNPDIFVNGVNEGELHASCSQDILGLVFGTITVVEYIDVEGGVISTETCPAPPAECDCDGKIVKMSVVYHGPSGATITVGADENGNNTTTYSDVQFGQILEVELGDIGNWWYWSVNGSVDASIHTSCSDDILGNVDSSKSIFGDLGDFPDPEDGDNNGTFLVISHTDSNGNTCSIDYNGASFRTAASVAVEKDPLPIEISEFSVNAWPNPTKNQFNIKVLSPNLTDKVNIEVFDMRGRAIHKDQFYAGYDYLFGDNLQSGLYFVRIQQGQSLETIKLMKR